MFLDFFDPQTIRFLEFWGEKTPYLFVNPQAENDIAAYGTHPYMREELWEYLPKLIPENCAAVVAGNPVLVHPETGRIFGQCYGNSGILLRFVESDLPRAIEKGFKQTDPEHRHFHNGLRFDFTKIGPTWYYIHCGVWQRECALRTWEALSTPYLSNQQDIESTISWFQMQTVSQTGLEIWYQTDKELKNYQPLIDELKRANLCIEIEANNGQKKIQISNPGKELAWKKEVNPQLPDCIFVPELPVERVWEILSSWFKEENLVHGGLNEIQLFEMPDGTVLVFNVAVSWSDFTEVLSELTGQENKDSQPVFPTAWFHSVALGNYLYIQHQPMTDLWLGVTTDGKQFFLYWTGSICEGSHRVQFLNPPCVEGHSKLEKRLFLGGGEFDHNTNCRITHPKDYNFEKY